MLKILLEKERECINLACLAMLQHEKKSLLEYKNWLPDYEPEIKISEITFSNFVWKESLSGKLIQLIAIPFILFLVLLIISLSPIIYLIEVWGYQERKNSVKKKIRDLDSKVKHDASEIDIDNTSSFYLLWDRFGLTSHYDDAERLQVLSTWVEVLYGQPILDSLELENRVAKIRAAQSKAEECNRL